MPPAVASTQQPVVPLKASRHGLRLAPLARQPMNILLLCEGDAESWDSWSGITKSLVDHLRMADHGAPWGYSDAVTLSRGELSVVRERELSVYRDAAGIFTLSERLRRSFIEDLELSPAQVHAMLAGPNLDVTRIPTTFPRDAV